MGENFYSIITRFLDYVVEKLDDISLERKKIVDAIKELPQLEQKSKQWFEMRNSCITATAVSEILDESPYNTPTNVLFDKCGFPKDFILNKFVHHGNKFEEIVSLCYSYRNNVKVDEYGLVKHPEYDFIGASPDGICYDTLNTGKGKSKLVGRLIEIKCPYSRKIETEGDIDDGICPHYYYLQVHTQLHVTNLDECDFVQCKIEEYSSYEEFIADSDSEQNFISVSCKNEKGIIIQLLPKNKQNTPDTIYEAKYIYPPKINLTNAEYDQWLSNEFIRWPNNRLYNDYYIDRPIYWKMILFFPKLIKKTDYDFEKNIPTLKQFWKYVLLYRKYPNLFSDLTEYMKKNNLSRDKHEDTKEIFSKIHEHYLSRFSKSTKEPLYQTQNYWRGKYNSKPKYNKSGFSKKKLIVPV